MAETIKHQSQNLSLEAESKSSFRCAENGQPSPLLALTPTNKTLPSDELHHFTIRLNKVFGGQILSAFAPVLTEHGLCGELFE